MTTSHPCLRPLAAAARAAAVPSDITAARGSMHRRLTQAAICAVISAAPVAALLLLPWPVAHAQPTPFAPLTPMPLSELPMPAPLPGGAAWSSQDVLLAAQEGAVVEVMREARADGNSGGNERVIKGAPYCAEAVHETVQWLPDPGGGAANRIVRQNHTRLCRDGEGRTRQEVERGGRRIVYLRDPVARESWVLDPERKTARRLAGQTLALGAVADAAVWRDYAEQLREWARATAEAARAAARAGAPGTTGGGPTLQTPPTPPTPPVPPVPPMPPAAGGAGVASVAPLPPPAPALITRVERAGGREAEVTVLRLDGERHLADAPLAPPPVQWRATHLAPRGAGVTTALPPRDFDGVRAHGERTTWTIEAGRVGNERPIQIVREVWTAPELLLTVSSRDFDPRTGEVLYRLKDLKRGEPDAALMRVPADFTRAGRSGLQPHPSPGGGAASAPRA